MIRDNNRNPVHNDAVRIAGYPLKQGMTVSESIRTAVRGLSQHAPPSRGHRPFRHDTAPAAVIWLCPTEGTENIVRCSRYSRSDFGHQLVDMTVYDATTAWQIRSAREKAAAFDGVSFDAKLYYRGPRGNPS